MINTQYEELLARILTDGVHRGDRTGTGTKGLFGQTLRYDLSEGLPVITTKKVFWHGVRTELIWLLSGSTNIHYLTERNVHIWDEWADENGDLGPVYGAQWRGWKGADGQSFDQITAARDLIMTSPESRRIIVNAWNVADVSQMGLPPCHAMFQFYVAEGKLSCALYQRSADMFLGVPFNIASYAALTVLMARNCGLEPGEFVWFGGDCHIYDNHVEQVNTQLTREPRSFPRLIVTNPERNLLALEPEDLILEGYDPYPAISAPVAI